MPNNSLLEVVRSVFRFAAGSPRPACGVSTSWRSVLFGFPQFAGTLLHPPLQFVVGLLQRLFRPFRSVRSMHSAAMAATFPCSSKMGCTLFSMQRPNRSSSKRTALPVRNDLMEMPHSFGGHLWGKMVSWFGAYNLVNGVCHTMCSGCIDQQGRTISIIDNGLRLASISVRIVRSLFCSLFLACFRSVMSSTMPIVFIGLPASSCIKEIVNWPHCLTVFAEIAFFNGYGDSPLPKA